MQYSFLASIENLRITAPVGNGWQIAGPIYFTNSSSVAHRLLNSHFRDHVGILESNSFLRGAPFIYAVGDYPLNDESPEAQSELLERHLRIMQLFFNVLWMFKDNALNFSLGFIQYPYFYPMPPGRGVRVSSNGRGVYFTAADGSRNEAVFTVEELRTAIDHAKNLFGPLEEVLYSEFPASGMPADAGRVERAFYFLQAARSSATLPQKIANYCTCFEALVSTDSAELSHKVSERVALLLTGEASEAESIFINLKSAYNTRSRYVHGDNLTANLETYRIQSVNCDEYLRRLLRQLAEDGDLEQALSQTKMQVDAFFNHRLFSRG